MNPELKAFLESEEFIGRISKSYDETMQTSLKEILPPMVIDQTKRVVDQLRAERAIFGHDRTGLTEEKKLEFAKAASAMALGSHVKANEALIEDQDNRGGFLVSTEVAAAIMRIAASVGLVMSQAQKWPMKTDELDIPAYTGAFLTGEYLGVDAVGSDTGLTFGQAKLITKTWQLSFVVGKALLADASVNLADWLLALGGESLANMIDRQGLVGSSNPFVGITNETTVGSATISGTAGAYRVIEDSSTLISTIAKSVRPGAIFVMADSTWALIRTQKDSGGNYILPQAGAVSARVLANYQSGSILQPDGEILGYPVHTSLQMPAVSTVGTSVGYIIFGNFKAFAYGDKGSLEVEEFRSGSFGGKEIAKAQQRGLVYSHRHGLVNCLPAAFAIAKPNTGL